MRNSRGKWIKSILSGKKPFKSKLSSSKRNVKDKVALDSSEVFEISAPVVVPTRNEVVRRQEFVVVEDVSVVQTKEEESGTKDVKVGTGEDPERIIRENATIKVQAAIRGYLAYREFRILKGIIRLQAVIRGHLVRRQAVATLRCVHGIIRFQALVRGQKVRMSAIGIEVQSKCDMRKFAIAKSPDKLVESATTIQEQLMGNNFSRKLQTLLCGTTPLCIQYDLGDPNSDREWVEHWTMSKFWESNSQPKNDVDLKSKTRNKHNGSGRSGEAEEHGKVIRGVRKQSGSNVGNVSSRATSESDKPKRNIRKSSSQHLDSRQDHNQNEAKKVRGNRKTFYSNKQASERVELGHGGEKVNERRASRNAASSEKNACVDEKTDTATKISKQADDAGVKLTSISNYSGALHELPDFNLQSGEDNVEVDETQDAKILLNSNVHNIGGENLNTSQKRASFARNFENGENGDLNTKKVPSYMEATESVRAKLKVQESTRFFQDEFEKNAMTRDFLCHLPQW